MKRISSLLLCLLLLIVSFPSAGRADDTELFYTTCVCSRYPEGTSIELLASSNRIYISGSTAGILLGMSADEPHPGKITYFSGNRKLTYEGPYISAFDDTWYPLEPLMDALNTRVVASASKLYFNNTNPALVALDAAMEDYEQIKVTFDPDDSMNKVGLGLSKFYDIVSNFSLSKLFGHRYEKEMYRTAVYALLRRSDDADENTFSDLYYYAEDEIVSPLSEFYSTMDDMFGEAVMAAFYAGTELEEIRQIINLYNASEKTFGVTPGDYIARLEELSFFNGACTSGVKGMDYLMECSPKDEEEEVLMSVMKQIMGTYKGNDDDELWTVLYEPLFEYGMAFADESYEKYMLGVGGSAVLKGVNAVMQRLPGMSAMDHLEMSAVYYHIQQFAARQIKQAYRNDDYIRLKYAGIIYYRCAYLFGVEMEQMGDSMLTSLAQDFKAAASEREAQLTAISDSLLLQSDYVNELIPARAMLGPVMDYIRIYENMAQNLGELDVRDYFGTEYLEEGNGIIAPWLHRIGMDTLLVVMYQNGSELTQMVFLDKGTTGYFNLVDERSVLTCGSNGSFYYAFDREAGPLLACASFDNNLTSYYWDGDSVETQYHPSDSWADSMSAMRQSAWNKLYAEYGSYEPAVEVDGSDGLFQISRSPAELRELFVQMLNGL